jgi:hypothetical protein
MDRRSFIIGAGSAILTAAFYRDIVRYAERKDEPLLLRPDDVRQTLYAIRQGDGYSLWLDNHPDEEPDWGMTWAEFYQHSEGYDWDDAITEIANRFGIEDEDAAAYAAQTVDEDELLEWHYHNELGSGLAVQFFQDVDLGPDFTAGIGRGEVCFADYRCAGPDRWCSEAADQLSLSLLQGRLNELGTGIEVKISHSTILVV